MTAEPDAPTRAAATTPAREAVVTSIRRAVVVGELQPGEKLTEVKLAAALDVSRATLREALNLLVQDGLLVQEPYRGFSVASLTPEQLRDIAATRVPLDLIAVHAILADTTGRRTRLLLDAWEQFDRRAFDPDPLVQHEAHVDFHHGLWAASENSMLLRLWPVTEAMATIALAQDQAAHHDPARAHRFHRLLVDAIVAGDLELIERRLHEHIVDATEELLVLESGEGS
ncbi:MAG: GntR family transcriptional regulator [Candidatus Nanopelagicales bacterium]